MSREAGELQFFDHEWIWGFCLSTVRRLSLFVWKCLHITAWASIVLMKGPRSRGTMTSFLCATQQLFLAESQPGFEEVFPVDMSMHWLGSIWCMEWIMPTGVFHVDTETSSKHPTRGVTPCEVRDICFCKALASHCSTSSQHCCSSTGRFLDEAFFSPALNQL